MARQPSLLSSLASSRTKDPVAKSFRPFEAELMARGFLSLAGVDEAGRGCLAGPVVAAAVILPPVTPELSLALEGVNDSKQLSASQRDYLFERVQEHALAFGVGEASPAEIDSLNVLRATHLAMSRAVVSLKRRADLLLIDGNQPIPHDVFVQVLRQQGLTTAPPGQKTIVKGDSLCLSIAAASILAKVSRDRLMMALALEYPGYGLEEHKGYPTPFHKAAVQKLGPSPIHRLSFRGVRADDVTEWHPPTENEGALSLFEAQPPVPVAAPELAPAIELAPAPAPEPAPAPAPELAPEPVAVPSESASPNVERSPQDSPVPAPLQTLSPEPVATPPLAPAEWQPSRQNNRRSRHD